MYPGGCISGIADVLLEIAWKAQRARACFRNHGRQLNDRLSVDFKLKVQMIKVEFFLEPPIRVHVVDTAQD